MLLWLIVRVLEQLPKRNRHTMKKIDSVLGGKSSVMLWHLMSSNGTGRSSHPEVFLGKVDLKIFSKFTGELPCQSVISIKLLCNFIEITPRHGCPPVNLPHIFRTPFLKNTSGWLLLNWLQCFDWWQRFRLIWWWNTSRGPDECYKYFNFI